MKKNLKNIILLFASVTISLFAGVIGSVFTFRNIPTWYAGLTKPPFSPPNWLFGPVWTILYILMGISLFLIIIKQKEIFSKPVKIFLLHLGINSLWSIVFFGMKSPGSAFLVIIVLWYIIYYLIKTFRKIDKRASDLLIPYLAWVSFASLLNFSVWILNI